MNRRRKVVIIGGGPAGLTAAIYSARAQFEPLIIEGLAAGGQLTTTTEVENYPGFPEGVDGTKLVGDMRSQAVKFGAEFVSEDVVCVDFASRPFKIKTDSQTVEADSIIISTGAKPRMLGLPAEAKLTGRGLSVCATCDGFFFRGKDIVVVGGGDSAMEEAIFLTRFAKSVKVIHRRDKFRASSIMVARAEANEKVEFVFNTVVEDILPGEDGTVASIKLKNISTGEVGEVKTEGVFVSIGHTPNTSLFVDKLTLADNGYLVTIDTRTNVEGVFACGDVQDSKYRQAVTAAGSGCQAALEAQWYLDGLKVDSEETSKVALVAYESSVKEV